MSLSQMAMLEFDGRAVLPGRDPPGQRSSYILPGDTERETYRLGTFAKFPNYAPVDPRVLALHGFYYTGYKDRVKCFSCGGSVQDWTLNDDPSSQNWHNDDCEFLSGREPRNIPICHSSFSPTLARRQRHSENEEHRIPAGLALMHGPNRASIQTARVSSPQPAVPTPPPSVVASTRAVERSQDDPEVSRNIETSTSSARESLFPCLDPVNSHMKRESARLSTFTGNRHNWPSDRINASFQQFAEAGLYYLGSSDRVKCWYCNGGLQNWRPNDQPWFEHAKWFPSCEYLLQKKGVEFVHNVVAQYPNLNRPTPRSGPTLQPAVSGLQRSSSSRVQIVDPREEQRKLKEKVDKFMSTSEIVKEATKIGFSFPDIRHAIERNFRGENCNITTAEQLIDDILAHPNQTPEVQEPATNLNPRSGAPSDPSRISPVAEQLHRLEEERQCKKCHQEKASVVLLPCGHIACCRRCGADVTTCPMCKSRVDETIASYIV
uniref:Baculoviral IAP repeat-containing protein 7-A-like n=1 Tax=Phallusia mammillata TaxID=59560 RepID=A0A6F9DXM2_9ASCI|nr:baculoviral IAP repeat-containing protein 7-A-like [Phallusia mammillata]